MRTYPLTHIPRGIRYESRDQMQARHRRQTRPYRVALWVLYGLAAVGAVGVGVLLAQMN
jgi:hypothetical protein